MICGLVHASYSLPEWQAVKLTFFASSMSESSMPHKVCSSTLVLNILMTILMIKSQEKMMVKESLFHFLFFFINSFCPMKICMDLGGEGYKKTSR